jgi:hypothetical protein
MIYFLTLPYFDKISDLCAIHVMFWLLVDICLPNILTNRNESGLAVRDPYLMSSPGVFSWRI